MDGLLLLSFFLCFFLVLSLDRDLLLPRDELLSELFDLELFFFRFFSFDLDLDLFFSLLDDVLEELLLLAFFFDLFLFLSGERFLSFFFFIECDPFSVIESVSSCFCFLLLLLESELEVLLARALFFSLEGELDLLPWSSLSVCPPSCNHFFDLTLYDSVSSAQ